MKDIYELKQKIAKHCDNNFKDSAAIGLTQFIFGQYSNNRVIANLDALDKWPSTDGYLELQTEDGIVGRIDVQVKSLPQNHKFSYDCPVPFLAYADIVSVAPCYLLLVDTATQEIYWLHISKEFIESDIPNYYKNTTTCRIKFNRENIISKANNNYFEEWVNIVDEYRNRIKEYELQKELVNHLTEHQNSAIGQINNAFIHIHIALDYIDYYLSTIFEPIKKVLFPKSWKIGIVLTTFKENKLGYLLYPIFYDINDVQIKFIDEKIYRNLYVDNKYSITNHLSNNPILENPHEFAFQACMKLYKDSISKYLFSLPVHDVLIQDIFEGLVKNYNKQLGIEKKLEHTITELKYAFNCYMPLWIDAAIQHLISNNINGIKTEEDCMFRNKSFFDPYLLAMQIIDKVAIENNTNQLIENEIRPKYRPVGSENNPIHLGYNFLHCELKDNIKYIYPQFDYKRCAENGNSIYNLLTAKQLEEKVKLIYSCLPEIYNKFVLKNFGEKQSELLYYSWFDLVVVEYDFLDIYIDYESPKLHIFYLTSLEPVEKRIVIGQNIIDHSKARHSDENSEIMYEGIRYKIISETSGIVDTMFHDYPLLKNLYHTLTFQLDHYIKTINSNI